MLLWRILVFCIFNIFLRQLKASDHFLSFIMPCYNCHETVARSLTSILQQKNLKIPFEIICTDDGSTDDTLSILRDYEQSLDNFHVYTHSHNKGGGAASNTCIKYAKGDLIFRLDADNVLIPNSIQDLVNLIDTTGADGAAFEEFRFFRGDFEYVSTWTLGSNAHHMFDLYQCIKGQGGDPGCSGNYLYTRSSYNRAGGYYEEHGSDTFCFGFRQYATGSQIAILPKTFYWHYYNPHGYWSRGEETRQNQKMIHKTFMEFREVFSESTKKFIKKLNPETQNPCDYYRKNFDLAKPEILEHLFKGYRYQEDNNYKQALQEFKMATQEGHISSKMLKRIKYCLKKLNSY